MNKIFIRLFVFFICLHLLSGCSKKPMFSSQWAENEITTDGLLDDWDREKMNYDKKSKMIYGISNDQENIYVSLDINDRQLRSKIMMTGLTLWLDSTGRKKKYMGIKFPVGRERNQMRNTPGNIEEGVTVNNELGRNRPNREMSTEGMINMELIGFGTGRKPIKTVKNNPGDINADIVMDQLGGFSYEAIIPFSKINFDLEKMLNDTSLVFSICFESGHIQAQPAGGGRSGGGRGRGGRGGGMPGGAGMPDGAAQGMQDMTQQTRLWILNVRFVSEQSKN